MSYQKCPVCNGTGESPNHFNHTSMSTPSLKCKVCVGTGIISELTGKPPSQKEPILESPYSWPCDIKDRYNTNITCESNCPNSPGLCFCTGACEKTRLGLSNNTDQIKDNSINNRQ